MHTAHKGYVARCAQSCSPRLGVHRPLPWQPSPVWLICLQAARNPTVSSVPSELIHRHHVDPSWVPHMCALFVSALSAARSGKAACAPPLRLEAAGSHTPNKISPAAGINKVISWVRDQIQAACACIYAKLYRPPSAPAEIRHRPCLVPLPYLPPPSFPPRPRFRRSFSHRTWYLSCK